MKLKATKLSKLARYIILPIALLSFVIQSCDNDITEPADESAQVEFAVNIQSDALKSTDAFFDAIIVTIKNSTGKIVYPSKRISLINFGSEYITEPIYLKVGDYKITDFMVVSSNNKVRYATPKEGSPKAYLVKDPLDIDFRLKKDEVKKLVPEVICSREFSPKDFGYSTFSFEIVKTFYFHISAFVYSPKTQNYELTDATLNVCGDTTEIFNNVLAAETNLIRINDGYSKYKVTISKPGYKTVTKTLKREHLKAYYYSPLMVNLDSE